MMMHAAARGPICEAVAEPLCDGGGGGYGGRGGDVEHRLRHLAATRSICQHRLVNLAQGHANVLCICATLMSLSTLCRFASCSQSTMSSDRGPRALKGAPASAQRAADRLSLAGSIPLQPAAVAGRRVQACAQLAVEAPTYSRQL